MAAVKWGLVQFCEYEVKHRMPMVMRSTSIARVELSSVWSRHGVVKLGGGEVRLGIGLVVYCNVRLR